MLSEPGFVWIIWIRGNRGLFLKGKPKNDLLVNPHSSVGTNVDAMKYKSWSTKNKQLQTMRLRNNNYSFINYPLPHYPLLPFFLYQSLNDSFGGAGISRPLYHGLSLLAVSQGMCRINQRPTEPPKRYSLGLLSVVVISFMAMVFILGL